MQSERIFQDTFSEITKVSEENNLRCAIQNISVSVPTNSVNVVKVGLNLVVFVQHKLSSH